MVFLFCVFFFACFWRKDWKLTLWIVSQSHLDGQAPVTTKGILSRRATTQSTWWPFMLLHRNPENLAWHGSRVDRWLWGNPLVTLHESLRRKDYQLNSDFQISAVSLMCILQAKRQFQIKTADSDATTSKAPFEHPWFVSKIARENDSLLLKRQTQSQTNEAAPQQWQLHVCPPG